MRRKLINFEAFDDIRKRSLSAAEYELSEASDILARALGIDAMELNCFGESNVIYDTLDGTYVHANYTMDHEGLTLESIEELVIDDESASKKSRDTIMNMVESILGNDDNKAADFFSEYMSLPFVRRNLAEGRIYAEEQDGEEGDDELNEGRSSGFVRNKGEAIKAGRMKSRNSVNQRGKNAERKRKLDAFGRNPNTRARRKRGTTGLGSSKSKSYQRQYYLRKIKPLHVKRKAINRTTGKVFVTSAGASKPRKRPKSMNKGMIKEWNLISENVLDYVDYVQVGPALQDAEVHEDDKGNITSIKIPNSRLRNEAKLLSFDWKMITQEYKILREQALHLSESQEFCKLVAEIKRQNNVSDNERLTESLNTLITKFPNVLYLTQEELSAMVSESLESLNVKNYDDDLCVFLAEGILRTAHDVYDEKVQKIINVARAEVSEDSEDAYLEFQKVVTDFYPTLDENFALEMKVYEDLFNAVNEVWNVAGDAGDAELRDNAEELLRELHSIVNGEADGDLELVEAVAEWLNMIAEEFSLSSWDVSNTPYITVNGDNPEMAKNATKGYKPSDFDSGNTPKSKTIDDTDKNIWIKSREGMWPNLSNPYIPKPFGDYTMKSPTGERGVDKTWEDGLGMQQGNDTWPNLKNPNIPTGETPKSYKAKVSGMDLVVDR